MTDFFAGDTRTNRERMPAGDPYIADDPDLEAASRRAKLEVAGAVVTKDIPRDVVAVGTPAKVVRGL
ncbi:hypothetical protein ACFHW2_01715 [Actinomadura sp. LOL_016]|uniref:hypothetical protein n=1 Tax=unclassified Actinomadura TaxID=2626254 RepID=UPI003A7F7DC4